MVRLSGVIAAPDGSSVIRAQLTGAAGDGEALGRRLAQTLLQEGGAALLDRPQCHHDQDRRQLISCHPAGRAVQLPE